MVGRSGECSEWSGGGRRLRHSITEAQRRYIERGKRDGEGREEETEQWKNQATLGDTVYGLYMEGDSAMLSRETRFTLSDLQTRNVGKKTTQPGSRWRNNNNNNNNNSNRWGYIRLCEGNGITFWFFFRQEWCSTLLYNKKGTRYSCTPGMVLHPAMSGTTQYPVVRQVQRHILV